jgi:hypothetical protein
MNRYWRVFPAVILYFSLYATAQDWGPNFGPERQQHESEFWAKKAGLKESQIREMRAAAHADDASINAIDLSQFASTKKVLLVVTEGSAQCNSFHLLRQTDEKFVETWSARTPGEDETDMTFCTFKCGSARAHLTSDNSIIIDIPLPASAREDPSVSCKRQRFKRWIYRSKGDGYRLDKAGVPAR